MFRIIAASVLPTCAAYKSGLTLLQNVSSPVLGRQRCPLHLLFMPAQVFVGHEDVAVISE
jgi:hypothetical protein